MRLLDFANILKDIGLEVRYRSFKKDENPKPPYIVYYENSSNYIWADNTVVHDSITVAVELVTEYKDLEIEQKIEQLFLNNKLYFLVRDELYIDSEDLFVKTYIVTVRKRGSQE